MSSRAAVSPPAPQPVSTTSFASQDSPHEREVHKVGADDFREIVLKSKVPVVVDFYADWCGPCKRVAPLLDRFARERTDVRVVKVNIDHEKELARKYRVRSIPTVMLFESGDLVAQHTGLPEIQKALRR